MSIVKMYLLFIIEDRKGMTGERKEEGSGEKGGGSEVWVSWHSAPCKDNGPRVVLASQKAHWENVYEKPQH